MSVSAAAYERQIRKFVDVQRERRKAGRCLRCGCPSDPKPGGGYYARCEPHRLENAWHRKLKRCGLSVKDA